MSHTTLTDPGPSSPMTIPIPGGDRDADRTLGTGEAAEQLDTIAELIDRGSPQAARRRMTWLTRRIDDSTRDLLVQCLQALEAPGPRSRTARLGYLLARTDDVGRGLVVACLPRTDPRRPETTTSGAPAAHVVDRAPRDHATRHIAPTGRCRGAGETATLRGTDRYFTRAELSGHGQDDSDEGPHNDAGYDGGDTAEFAVAPQRGAGCVSCFTERPVADQRRRPDDGLCEQCRESGRSGIPAPTGHRTRADAVAARCQFLTDRAGSAAAAVALMRREWRAAAQRDRVEIVAWVQGQPALAALLVA